MNTQSEFQQKFPLSAKKFTKKIIPELLGGLFFTIFIAIVPAAIFVGVNANKKGFLVGSTSDVLTTLLGWYIISFILIYIIRSVLYVIYWKTYIKRYYYDCGNDFVTIHKNVFTPSEIHVQYPKIQDVYVDQDLMDRFLGIYDVHIASATVSSGIEAHIDGVDGATAEGIKNFLLNAIKNGTSIDNKASSIPQQSVQQQAIKINLTENISSETYPISSNWILQKSISSLFSSIGFIIFILLGLFTQGKNNSSSMAQNFGLTFSEILPYLILLLIILWVGMIIFNIIWKKNYNFKLLSEYVYVYSGVITNQEQHIPYDRIQDVIVRQNILEKILGLSSVYIQNAVAGTQTKGGILPPQGIIIPGQSMEKSKILSEIIRNILIQKNQKTGL